MREMDGIFHSNMQIAKFYCFYDATEGKWFIGIQPIRQNVIKMLLARAYDYWVALSECSCFPLVCSGVRILSN